MRLSHGYREYIATPGVSSKHPITVISATTISPMKKNKINPPAPDKKKPAHSPYQSPAHTHSIHRGQTASPREQPCCRASSTTRTLLYIYSTLEARAQARAIRSLHGFRRPSALLRRFTYSKSSVRRCPTLFSASFLPIPI